MVEQEIFRKTGGFEGRPARVFRRAAWASSRSIALALGAAFILVAPPASAQAPPGTGTDMELDPDAPKEEPRPVEPPPLPPPDPEGWGQGGKEEEGKFAPKGKTGALKEEEDERKEAEEDKGKGPVDLGLPGAASLDIVIGFGELNEVLSEASIPSNVTVFSFVFGVEYRAWDIWTLGLRFPYSTGSITGPLPSESDDFNTFALGNVELSVRPSFQITRRLRMPVGVAVTLPFASGDSLAVPDERGLIAQALINQAVSGSRGWEDNALFASKRFGFSPSVGVTYDRGALHLAGQTKLELMVKAGGNDLDPDPAVREDRLKTAELNDPTVNWVLGGSAFYDFLDGMVSPGLRTWLSVASLPFTNNTRDFSGAQFVIEPGVQGKVGLNATGSLALKGGLSYILPLGGPLGGRDYGASTGGLRVKAALLF